MRGVNIKFLLAGKLYISPSVPYLMLSLTRKPGDEINCYHPDGSKLNIYFEEAGTDYIVVHLNNERNVIIDFNNEFVYYNLIGHRIEVWLIRIRSGKYIQVGIIAPKNIRIVRAEIDVNSTRYGNDRPISA